MIRLPFRSADKASAPKTSANQPPPPRLALGERFLVVTLMVGAWAGASLISLADRR